jgi:hypothetical protein
MVWLDLELTHDKPYIERLARYQTFYFGSARQVAHPAKSCRFVD